MLEMTIDETEVFDEKTMRIYKLEPVTVRLEHSLLSLSKWETYWEKPFLTDEKKTKEQLLSYVQFMSEEPIPMQTLSRFEKKHFEALNEYLESKHSATFFSDEPTFTGRKKIVTTELIYYWMTAFNIPFECERWPLARLMNLIRIAQIKAEEADPTKKKRRRSSSELLSERSALNAKRREQLKSKG